MYLKYFTGSLENSRVWNKISFENNSPSVYRVDLEGAWIETDLSLDDFCLLDLDALDVALDTSEYTEQLSLKFELETIFSYSGGFSDFGSLCGVLVRASIFGDFWDISKARDFYGVIKPVRF